MNKTISLYHSFARCIYLFIITLANLVKLPFHKQYYISQSYFPEFKNKRKNTVTIFFEQVKNILKYSQPNKFYFLYGLDINDFHKPEDFVDYTLFMRRRYIMDNKVSFNAIPVLRDKSLFGIVASAYGIPTPRNLGIISQGKIYLFAEKKEMSYDKYIQSTKESDVFIKKIDGECADGVYHATIKNGTLYIGGKEIDCISFFSKKERYLVQATVQKQHPAIRTIFDKSLNTLRLVTAINPKTNLVEAMSCVLRVGTGNNNVDNWAAGGLSIGVDTERGVLREYGFYKPGFGTKATQHPNTGIVFKDYEIPYMQEAINMAKEFHSKLYGIHSIGWDIAITEEGPCFVEGNDNWEISLMQISNHGLKKEFNNLFY